MLDRFYSGKRVLVTGHTGFKGAWLSLWLHRMGASVHGYSLSVPTTPSLYESLGRRHFADEIEGDVRDLECLERSVRAAAPDLVFHLAAQSLVRASYRDALTTVETNTLGTVHLLEALRRGQCPATVILVTTDKCYENRELDYAYVEMDSLGGKDPYSASKAAAEVLSRAWRDSFFGPGSALGRVATARAGNVLGGGDYAPERIVPDLVRARLRGESLSVRYPLSTRPWQHVLDCLSGYLWLAQSLTEREDGASLAGPFNFGPGPASNRSVQDLVEAFGRVWPGDWHLNPPPLDMPEAAKLHLSIDKAASQLEWRPVWDFETTMIRTAEWYHQRHHVGTDDMRSFTLDQILEYEKAAQEGDLRWAATE